MILFYKMRPLLRENVFTEPHFWSQTRQRPKSDHDNFTAADLQVLLRRCQCNHLPSALFLLSIWLIMHHRHKRGNKNLSQWVKNCTFKSSIHFLMSHLGDKSLGDWGTRQGKTCYTRSSFYYLLFNQEIGMLSVSLRGKTNDAKCTSLHAIIAGCVEWDDNQHFHEVFHCPLSLSSFLVLYY